MGQCWRPLAGRTAICSEGKSKPSVGSLGVALNDDAEGLHRIHPLADQLPKPLLLHLGAPDEATQVPLSSQVVDLEAKAFKSLVDSGSVFHLADVIQLSGLGKVAVWWAKLHKEVEAPNIWHCFASRACIITVSQL